MSLVNFNPIRDLFEFPSFGNFAQQLSFPKVDVSEKDGVVTVSADIPGMDKKDVKVDYDNGVLTISGKRSSSHEEKDEKRHYHRVEREWGSFSRSIAVPRGVDLKDIKATHDKGVLTVTMPNPHKDSDEAKKKTTEVTIH